MAQATSPNSPVRLKIGPFTLAQRGPLPISWLLWLGEALRPGANCLSAPPALDDATILPALSFHGVAPLLYLRLRADPLWLHLESALQQGLTASYHLNAVRSYLLQDELARITAALEAQHVPVLLLKGLALAEAVYDSLAERPVSDLDLLAPAAAIDAAQQVLASMGYRPLGLHRFGRWQRRYRSELPMVCMDRPGGRAGLLIELHWSLVESPYHVDHVWMDDIWQRSQPSQWLLNVRLPDLTTLLLHSAAHLALHHSQELRLIWLLDMDRLARHPDLDWDDVLAQAEAWGFGLALQAALSTSGGWLGTPWPEVASTRLAALAKDRASVDTWGMGDNRPGRAWRRARATWRLLGPRQRLRYAAWLGLRAAAWPMETWEQRAAARANAG